MPTKTAVSRWESFLRGIGATAEQEARLPDQLQVWRPENAGGWEAFDSHWWEYCEALSTCLKRTRRGDRAFVYESGEGVTAIIDFQGETSWLPDWGYVAPGLFRPLLSDIPRTALARRAVLGPLLRRGPVSGQNLSKAQARAIAQLAGDALPRFYRMPPQSCADEEVEWFRADKEWGLELPMRDAVLSSGEWQKKKLFKRQPLPEVRSGDAVDRYDLITDQTVRSPSSS